MRAFRRVRWLLPALAIPAAVAAVGIGLQAAAFGRAPEDTLDATRALRELVRYHVMRGTETLAGRRTTSTCVQGWFEARGHARLVRGSLVLLGNGERLWDLGAGVRRVLRDGPTRPASRLDRARFVLAGCPRFIGNDVGAELAKGRPVESFDNPAVAGGAASILLAQHRSELRLDFAPVSYKPVGLSLVAGPVRGSSVLVPGGGAAAVRRLRRAFELPARARSRRA